LKDLNTEGIDVIGLAKEGKERGGDKVQDRVYCIGKRDPVNLSKWPAVLFLLQRIRDEAHRSAVTYHRKLKREQDFRSVLDAIPGIGASRKKALLRFFGDIRKIRESSVDMLQKVDGIGRQAAEKIHTFLRGEKGEKRE
jgi:excinuclease ABC subunit C